MFLRRICSLCLCVFLLSQTVVCFGETILDLDTVKQQAVECSTDLQNVKIDRIKKQIELKQAQEGIRDIRKKESTIKYSLLVNIEFPKKHGMPKEIELIMKVPQIQKELTVLEQQEQYETLKAKNKAEQAYYNVLQEKHAFNDLENRLLNSKQILKDIEAKYKMGKGQKEDVDYLKSQIRDLETEKQKATLNLDVKAKKLGGLIGKEVRYGYEMEESFPTISLERNQLPEMTAFSQKHDFELFKKIQDRKLAERDTQEILEIYKNRYGKYVKDIESYIKYNEGKQMDYDQFIQMYQHTLTEIDHPWEGNYVIHLLFFKIKIPKEWFKGEFSGTRYMEDQKYALFVSLTERDKARKAEQDAEKALEDNIYDAYSSLKQMESAYDTAKENLELAKRQYEEQKRQNKLGLVTFRSLESSRENFNAKQNGLYEMKIEYAKVLSNFNLSTSGYLDALLSGEDFEQTQLQSGDTIAESPRWYLKNNVTEYNFEFGVKIPKEFGVEEYQLFYGDMPVGNKQKIDAPLIHLPLLYADSTLMEVRFYQNGTWTYQAKFDGGQYEGELTMKKVSENKEDLKEEGKTKIQKGDKLGTWKLSKIDELRSRFSIATQDNSGYTEYEVLFEETSLGKAKKLESITTLSLYFSEKEKLSIRLYENGKLVQSGELENGTDSGSIVVR